MNSTYFIDSVSLKVNKLSTQGEENGFALYLCMSITSFLRFSSTLAAFFYKNSTSNLNLKKK